MCSCPQSLFNAFLVHCVKSTIVTDSRNSKPRYLLVFEAVHYACWLVLNMVANPKDQFSKDIPLTYQIVTTKKKTCLLGLQPGKDETSMLRLGLKQTSLLCHRNQIKS